MVFDNRVNVIFCLAVMHVHGLRLTSSSDHESEAPGSVLESDGQLDAFNYHGNWHMLAEALEDSLLGTTQETQSKPVHCDYDAEDREFFKDRNPALKQKTLAKIRPYIVINEARSGSSWFQEMSMMHPGIKTQFELDLEHAPSALTCQQCDRPETPNSIHMDHLPTKMHPPLACGMSIFGSANAVEDIKDQADKHDASLIILLRRNHFKLALSSRRMFVKSKGFATTPEEMSKGEFWSDDQWKRQLNSTTQAYERLLEIPFKTGRPSFLVFYEDLVKDPQTGWANVQNFLHLPPNMPKDIEGVQTRASQSGAFSYVNEEQLKRMRRKSSLKQWQAELSDESFDENFNSQKEFERICEKSKDKKASIYWKDMKCINGIMTAM